jgi:hypothetical protein
MNGIRELSVMLNRNSEITRSDPDNDTRERDKHRCSKVPSHRSDNRFILRITLH